VVLTTHPLLAPRLRKSRAITLLPFWALVGLLYVDLYLYLYLTNTGDFTIVAFVAQDTIKFILPLT
jgi:hypothetical protein